MTNLLKTFLHLLSIVVLCSAMAACNPVDQGTHYSGYDSVHSVSGGGTTSLFE